MNMEDFALGPYMSAFDFRRDGAAYFRELHRRHPFLFSSTNVERLRTRTPPIIDEQWIQHNPSHVAFKGKPLVHHYWMQGPTIVPLPAPVHIHWASALHPFTQEAT